MEGTMTNRAYNDGLLLSVYKSSSSFQEGEKSGHFISAEAQNCTVCSYTTLGTIICKNNDLKSSISTCTDFQRVTIIDKLQWLRHCCQV